MRNLNITYYFGQIKPEYRGKFALFVEMPKEGDPTTNPSFTAIHLDTDRLMQYSEGDHSPIRSYIGVNEQAKSILVERYERKNLNSAFGLDMEIVREEIVKRRDGEVADLEEAVLKAAIATGK